MVQKQRNFGAGDGTVSVSAANKVKRGDIRHAVVVRTAKKYQRPDGSVVKFDDNACVLINKAGEPIGTRLNGASSTPSSFPFLPRLPFCLCHSLSPFFRVHGRAKVGGWERHEDRTRHQTPLFCPNHPADLFLPLTGLVGAELRNKGWSKILSLAPMHL